MDQDAKTIAPEAAARWKEISASVEEVWAEVLSVADTVLKAHAKFGFDQFAEKIDPSLDEILFGLQIIESVLDTISATGNLEYSELRKISNAKQQILWVQTIGNALKYGNEADYLDSIGKLGNQSKV